MLSVAALAAVAFCGDISSLSLGLPTASAFVPSSPPSSHRATATTASSSSTSLHMALGVLARKAKEASLREYVKGGLEDSVRAKVDELKKAASTDSNLDPHPTDADWAAGPVQAALTKRKGTITVIAEYKRKLEQSGFIDEVFSPEILSPSFREFGATAVAVMADDRVGGCTYADVEELVQEQQGARGEMPGPLPVISSDIIVDELQLCQSAAYGAEAVVLMAGVIGMDKCKELKTYADLLQLECIVAVTSKEEAQAATRLQSGFRGFQARRGVEERRAERAELASAATKVQAGFRGHQDRKKIADMKRAGAGATSAPEQGDGLVGTAESA